MKIIILSYCMLWLSSSASGGIAADNVVNDQIERIWDIRQECGELEEFGRKTMGHSMKILRHGDEAVSCLLRHLEWETDWMIRFWIVDLLGYVQSERSIEVLANVIKKNAEDVEIRVRAVQSLVRLKNENNYQELLRLKFFVSQARVKKEITRQIRIMEKIIQKP